MLSLLLWGSSWWLPLGAELGATAGWPSFPRRLEIQDSHLHVDVDSGAPNAFSAIASPPCHSFSRKLSGIRMSLRTGPTGLPNWDSDKNFPRQDLEACSHLKPLLFLLSIRQNSSSRKPRLWGATPAGKYLLGQPCMWPRPSGCLRLGRGSQAGRGVSASRCKLTPDRTRHLRGLAVLNGQPSQL